MAMVRIDRSAKKKEDHQRFKGSYSSRALHVFRNILNCGATDANGAALMPIGSGSGRHRRSTSDVLSQRQHHQESSVTDNNSRKSRRRMMDSSASYKPLGGSQLLAMQEAIGSREAALARAGLSRAAEGSERSALTGCAAQARVS